MFPSIGLSSLKSKLIVLVGIFISGLALFGYVSYSTVNQVKVTGPLYDQLVRDKELLADFSPPIGCLVEANLLARQMCDLERPEDLGDLVEAYEQIKTNHRARVDVWRNRTLFPATQDVLFKMCIPSAERFLSAMDQELIPALKRGEREAAKKVLSEQLTEEYDVHRAAIDNLVLRASKATGELESEVKALIQSRTNVLLGTGLAITCIGCLLAAYMVITILRQMRRVIQTLNSVAEGDLTQNLNENSGGEFGRLAKTVNRMIDALQESKRISEYVNQIEDSRQSQGAVIAKSAFEAARVANIAVSSAEKTNSIIHRLNTSTREISEVVKSITGVTDETNLLALNAMIEAARAGESGKGFAVVASEVKELARTTSIATDDISKKIDAIQIDAMDVIGALNDITAVIHNINGILGSISTSAEEQSNPGFSKGFSTDRMTGPDFRMSKSPAA